jgi:hypothetical protein
MGAKGGGVALTMAYAVLGMSVVPIAVVEHKSKRLVTDVSEDSV